MPTIAGNVLARGPKWAQVPFYSLDNVDPWWDSREALREEALKVRPLMDHRFLLEVPNTGRETSVTLDFQFVSEHTPVLNTFRENFFDRYGDLGSTHTHYFYIDENANYEWHRDNVLPTATTEEGKNLPVNCCMNVIVTDDGSECEFAGAGTFKYTAGILNTSILHRIQPSEIRILARISFLDLVYEEVVHKIRKVNKQLYK